MALRDIFKFRDLPESETSKPFLEHLEDLRWMIVKMAMTLAVAMVVCFAFRATLVRVLQAPLHDVGSQIGTLKALGITDSIVISFHLAFYAGIVVSFPLLPLFSRPICSARAHRSREAVFVSRDFRQLRAVSSWCFGLLLLVVTKNDPLFLSRHRVARLGAHLDGAAVLFFCDAIHDRVRSGF
jgi:hypothetical protein